jgi:hypothetical protein
MKGRGVLTCQRFNKLSTIYRLCAALEVEPAEVLPRIMGMCERSYPDVVMGRDENPSDESGEGLDDANL